MIVENLTLPVIGSGLDLVLKLGVSVGFMFYIVFAFVIVKQVNKMTDTLSVGLEGLLRFVAYVHLVFAIAAFAFAFIIL